MNRPGLFALDPFYALWIRYLFHVVGKVIWREGIFPLAIRPLRKLL